ncbi:MAG: recombination protein RecR [Syntrophomonadaceae bacterium]|jgi:recombination protein RecR|nr:recombination protein RecR [Syntrophomonadaceae bacterium]
MMRLTRALENLIEQLQKLPTIGPKTAQRLALHLLKVPEAQAQALAEAIIEARTSVRPCSQCGYLTEADPCVICRDSTRDKSLLCIAEEASDVMAIERSGYRGQYYVINKAFSLMGGNRLEDIDLAPLLDKLSGGEIRELILALNPDIDGEVLARYIAGLAAAYPVRITRLAHGLPVGGDIEYTDEITLRKAIEGRKEI